MPLSDRKPQPNSMRQTHRPDPLALLEIFNRLEVGPVKVEKRRVVAPYKIIKGKKAETTDLIYTYEEDAFDPEDRVSRNLASMIAAQVALNYGLFCRSIVFRGVFDDTDRRFISAMAENTAREIFVKKFLEPNPFLMGPAARLRAVKQKNYLRATLQFPEPEPEKQISERQSWAVDRKRHCVLSSGGKDSLLTYGLLNEIGQETHPIFINESGRHWFTALNAYRYFKRHVPNTARVWTNSDRVFNWMLRRMPFIRQDFARVRSDEYPIRLWTVAVFMFGALPLLRKRQIGKLSIGDEFDTTHRTSFKDITHYDGLYDQSRYFDEALSRYFLKKGWPLSVFSVVRPLSELLIEKILVKRYLHLQVHQLSCHATHKDNGRVRPCGRCEKCRRIVGMLTAINGDPRRCGYTDKSIKGCLTDLATKKVHQEAAGAEQLLYLLAKKGLVKPRRQPREHPEIMKIRFDPEKSPLNAVPEDLRETLYRIMLRYSDGAARRVGRSWVDFDPLGDPQPAADDIRERKE